MYKFLIWWCKPLLAALHMLVYNLTPFNFITDLVLQAPAGHVYLQAYNLASCNLGAYCLRKLDTRLSDACAVAVDILGVNSMVAHCVGA